MHLKWARIRHDKRAFQQRSISFRYLSFCLYLFISTTFYEYKLILRNCNRELWRCFLCLESMHAHTFCRTSLAILHVAINRPNQRPNMDGNTLSLGAHEFDHDFSVFVSFLWICAFELRTEIHLSDWRGIKLAVKSTNIEMVKWTTEIRSNGNDWREPSNKST